MTDTFFLRVTVDSGPEQVSLTMQKIGNWNGPTRELGGNEHLEELHDDVVYCVVCGNIFVFARGRDCPTCTIANKLGLGDDNGQ